jgi:tetratricopeptide (TPR) repeat protein
MKEKRDLVNAIVAKARRQEEQGQYSEALGQWEILRTVYGQYPGLELEIDRVSKRRGQMVSNEGKAHCTERIDRMIERREWAQAAALLRDAQNDFPGDVELEELAKLVKQGEERNARAESLTDQARELSAQKKFDEAVRLLRQAYQSDERNLSVRGLLVETLVQRAQWLLDTDWQRAGEVVQSALELDPGNSQACDLAALVADRTRDEAVEPDVNRARQLQTGGDLTGALGSVEQSMALHPNAPRLHQLRSTLQRSLLDATRAQMRQTDLEILTRLQMQAETEKNPDAQREILSNVRDLAAKYLDDPEFQTALIGVEKRFVLMGRPAAQRVAADTTTKEPRLSLTEVPSPVTKAPGAAPPPVPPVIPPPVPVAKKPAPATPPTPPVAALPPRPPAKPAAQPPKSRKWIAWAVAVPVLLAGAVGAVLLHQRQAPKPAAAPVAGLLAVEIRTSPEGATIQVNEKVSGKSNLQLKLAPGDYRINAVLDGFRPAQTTVNVATGHAASADITLVPLASTLKLITDFPSGSATFDGHPQSNLQSGQLILDNVANGSHLLDFRSGTSGAAIRFDAHAGAPPVVTSVDADKDTSAILITNLGSRARIYSSQKTGSITIDGKPAGPVDPKGVELNDIAPGDHEITVGDGADSRKVVYETAAVPEVTIYLNKGQQTVGMLVVNTGEDDVVVSINGRPGRVTTKRGQLRIPGMSPGDYAISVSKDGFQPVMEQRVTVNKGDEAKVTFQMRPLLKIAALRVAGATPGTQIFVDGKLVGAAGLDGGMAAVQVPPGTHRVELRKEDYKTKIYDLTFSAGDNRTLTGADVALEATSATLTVSVTPSNAQLTIQRAGDAQAKPLTAGSAHLAVGQYVVSATLAHYVPHSETFELSGGATKNVSITLAPEKVAVAKPAPVHIGMSGWQDPWQPDGDHFTRRGGNLCLFKPQGPGTYSFTASLKHGKQLRWVAHAIDEKNYVEFELDSDTFTRALVVNGKAKELVKRKHGISLQPVEATVQVTITPAGIVQRIQKLGSWSVLDSWTDSTLHEGRFGFLVRGHDEVSLSGFGFTGLE